LDPDETHKISQVDLVGPPGSFVINQELRSASQPLQRWQHERAALETELLLEFVDTELLRMPFPRQDTQGDETTGDMMDLGPL
jgi:hypothetical protein